MQETPRSSLVVLAAFVWIQACVAAQQQPSLPISELSVTAGQPIIFDLPLTEPFTAPFAVSANYIVDGTPPNAPLYEQQPPAPSFRFGCSGQAYPGNSTVRLVCGTPLYAKAGVYRVDSHGLQMTRQETFESTSDSTLRFPIITLKEAKHPEKSGFPGLGQPILFPTIHEALEDEADRTQQISDVVVKHYLEGEGDHKEEDAYLLDVISKLHTILKLTSYRFDTVLKISHKPLPIFFEDFHERLNQLGEDIPGPRRDQKVDLQFPGHGHIIFAQQIPHTTDSVDAQTSKDPIRKHYADLVEIMAEIIDLPARIMDDGTSEFEWSLIATPPGAEVYYSRLHKEENHWAGGTPIEKAKLPYARWTWRIAWGNCSKQDRPDPYLQAKIAMKETETGCKSQ